MEAVTGFVLGMIGSRPIEMIAVACGLANVILIIRRNLWNYPFGVVMVILYGIIFYEYKLYSDALLQVYFLLIQFYGLWIWFHNREASGLVLVARTGLFGIGAGVAACVAGTVLLGSAMQAWTDASYPYWDATVATCSVVAQLMMSRRLLESWLFWIIVDVTAISLFWVKDLQPTAALYGVFLVLAVTGYVRWRAALRSGSAV